MQLASIVVQPQNVTDGSKVVATAYLDSNDVAKDVQVDFYVSDTPTWKGERAMPVGQAYTDQFGVAYMSFDFDPIQFAPAIATADQLPVQTQIQGLDNLFPQLADTSKILYLVAYCPQAGDGVAATMVYDASGLVPSGGVAMGSGSINAQTGAGATLNVQSPVTVAVPAQSVAVTANSPSGLSNGGFIWLGLILLGIFTVYMARKYMR